MNRVLLFLLLIFVPFSMFSQFEIDGKPLSDKDKEMVKQAVSRAKILSEVADISCKCIDSIDISDSNPRENAVFIKRCIDEQVMGYQSTVKMFESVDLAKGEDVKITIYSNPESDVYISYYREIERKLMDSCQAIKDAVGANNRINEKSISDKSAALKEYNAGNDFLRKNDYANALPFYEKAVKIDPNFAFAWDNIGVCNRRLGDFDAAIKAYKKSIKVDPVGLTARTNIALAYVGNKDFKMAIKSYEDLAKLDKDNPEVYYGLGIVYFQNLEDYEKALNNLCKAYNLYIQQESAYRSDAEKVIQMLYNTFKEQDRVAVFEEILKSHNISVN